MAWDPRNELLSEEFARSPGPGGQNVNRRSTKVQIFYRFVDDPQLSEAQKSRIRERYSGRLVGTGTIMVSCAIERSRERNRVIARALLTYLIRKALQTPKERVPTKKSHATRQRELEAKRRRSEVKRLRKPIRGW